MSFKPPFDPDQISFGPKDGKFARTALDGNIVKFKIADPDKPLRAAIKAYRRLRPEVVRRDVDKKHAVGMAHHAWLEKKKEIYCRL